MFPRYFGLNEFDKANTYYFAGGLIIYNKLPEKGETA